MTIIIYIEVIELYIFCTIILWNYINLQKNPAGYKNCVQVSVYTPGTILVLHITTNGSNKLIS